MKNFLLPVMLCCCLAAGSTARGDIMSFDYNVNDSNVTTIMSSPPSALSDSATYTGIDFSFNYAAGVLDLVISGLGATETVGFETNWNFSNATFASATDFITGVSTTSSLTPSSLTFGADSIQISTGASDVDASGTLNYSFAVSLNSTSAAVPEPSSLAGLGLLGVGAYWIRRKKQVA